MLLQELLTERFFSAGHFGYGRTKQYTEIFQNPSTKELGEIPSWRGPYSSVRAVIDFKKNLFVWDSDVLHSDIIKIVSPDNYNNLIRIVITNEGETFSIEGSPEDPNDDEPFTEQQQEIITDVLQSLFPGKVISV